MYKYKQILPEEGYIDSGKCFVYSVANFKWEGNSRQEF